MSLRGEINQPDTELLASLTAESGPLCAGAMPALDMGNDEGVKNMCQSVAGEQVTKAKKRKEKPSEPAEPVVPATMHEIGA
eukprot:Skav219014  [mRNA]  locus=scaffold2475:9875:10117:+ [translate_table: standard]